MNRPIDSIIVGLQLIAKYGSPVIDCHHDEIIAMHSDDPMSEEDKKAMQEAGWVWHGKPDFYWVYYI